MNEPNVPHSVLFPDLFHKAVVATFDQPHASSDGGALLLKAAERRLGVLAALTAKLADTRMPSKVTHTIGDLLAQRVFAIACGHPDGNDADRLADDPIHKLLLDRDPIDGARLGSQPTISRFEQAASGPRKIRGARTLSCMPSITKAKGSRRVTPPRFAHAGTGSRASSIPPRSGVRTSTAARSSRFTASSGCGCIRRSTRSKRV